jgi:hypothetical protein
MNPLSPCEHCRYRQAAVHRFEPSTAHYGNPLLKAGSLFYGDVAVCARAALRHDGRISLLPRHVPTSRSRLRSQHAEEKIVR